MPAVASTIAASETRTRGIIFSVQGDNFLYNALASVDVIRYQQVQMYQWVRHTIRMVVATS